MPRQSDAWISESYSVRRHHYERILRHLHALPDVDGFSLADSAKCQHWWGPGSPFGEDAFQHSWKGLTLWLNPPFSRLDEVLDKIILAPLTL